MRFDWKRSIPLILALATAWTTTSFTNAVAHAQTKPAATTTEKSAADLAFEPLQKEYDNLYHSLLNSGGVGKEDHQAIEALRDRIDHFIEKFPNDQRGLTADLYLSTWLSDGPRIDAAFARLIKARPDDQKIRLTWAKQLANQNQFAKVIDALSGVKWDDASVVDASLLLSQSLFAENRFQESIDALTNIPTAVLADSARKQEVDSFLTQRKPYPELWTKEQELRKAEEQANDLPRAEIVTASGPIVVELFENEAPNTVANFIKLVEDKFYNGTKFHRVIPTFMAQGGDAITKTGATPLNYRIADEVGKPNARNHFTGSIAMAKTDAPDSADSQFYLTHLPTPWLNGKHTVFGRVITGEDTVRALKQDDVIESINILRKRNHEYVPVTIPLTPPASLPTFTPTTVPATPPDSSSLPVVPGAVTGNAPATQPN